LVHTARTRRRQPKGTTRNARVPSASKNSEVKKNINPSQTPRVDLVPKKQSSASIRTDSITKSQHHVIVKKNVSSSTVTASSTGLVHTARTRRPQPKGTTRNARVPYASKNSEVKKNVVQICLWCVDSGCSKHMTRNIKLLINFVWKFLGTVHFGNDHIAAILGYGDLKWGSITITRVYFVEGLGHNLFSVGQFCDADLEVAFRRNTCFIRDLDVASINGKRYVLVIEDDYSRYTWVHFLITKDETPEEYFDSVSITHETSVAKTPQQNGVVERRNHTLVEAARTMLIFSHALLFLWAEAIATVCYTQNCSIIHRRFNKTPYELIQGRKPNILYLHVFGALCYPKNDREYIGKLGVKSDIGFFIRYSANSVAYRVSRPGLQSMTSGQISSELELTYALSTISPQRPSERDLDILFKPLHNEFLGGRPAEAPRAIPDAPVLQNLQAPTASMSFQYSAPVPTNSTITPVSLRNIDATSPQHAQEQKNHTPLPTNFLSLKLAKLVWNSKPFDTLANLGSCVNMIPLYLFKKFNIRLLRETDHIFGLVDGTKSYPVGIVKDVEVHIGKRKLLNYFYVIDLKKDPETLLLVGRGFLEIANAVIDCRKAKIAVGEGITRSVFRVKGVDLGKVEAPYWTMLGKGNHTNHNLAQME
nr:integrase, catalytic region, zinc finger, CCHC-type, peptidase aspartic, catalytic [Tanacetum cinerariifolium]